MLADNSWPWLTESHLAELCLQTASSLWMLKWLPTATEGVESPLLVALRRRYLNRVSSPCSTQATSSAPSPANTSSSRQIAAGADETLLRSVETSGKEGDTPSFGDGFAAKLVSWGTGGMGNEAVPRRIAALNHAGVVVS